MAVGISIFWINEIAELLLYGNLKFDFDQDNKILNSSVAFILKSKA